MIEHEVVTLDVIPKRKNILWQTSARSTLGHQYLSCWRRCYIMQIHSRKMWRESINKWREFFYFFPTEALRLSTLKRILKGLNESLNESFNERDNWKEFIKHGTIKQLVCLKDYVVNWKRFDDIVGSFTKRVERRYGFKVVSELSKSSSVINLFVGRSVSWELFDGLSRSQEIMNYDELRTFSTWLR